MTTPTVHADNIMAAIEDAERLVPWARANRDVQMFGTLANVVRRALNGPVPAECAFATPLLRTSDPTICARSLLSARIDWRMTYDVKCSLCGVERTCTDRLTVLAGASAVWLHFCPRCKDLLNETFAGLHWDCWEDGDQ